MIRRFAVLPLLAVAAVSTGCASITAPRNDYLRVVSQPPGASVRVNGIGGGYTPAVVEVDKQHPPVVDVSVPGQPPFICSTRMSAATGYVVADILLCVFLFPFGCVSFIDASGAWNELDHPFCAVTFAPGTKPPAPPHPPPTAPGRVPPPAPSPPPPPAPPSHD